MTKRNATIGRNFNTDAALEMLNKGEDFIIKDVDPKKIGYVRCWATRHKFFSKKIGNDIVISKEKEDSLRLTIFTNLPTGNDFWIEGYEDQEQVIRNYVSIFNSKHHSKYKVNKFKYSKGFMIYKEAS